MLTFLTKTFTKRTEPGQRQSVTHEGYIVHCYVRSDGLAGTVTTDAEYPARVAFVLLGQLLEEFTAENGDTWKTVETPDSVSFPKIEEYLVKYQDPAAADKVTKIQKDLDETTQILHNTIDQVLERGVKLDSLVERSNDLSSQSKLVRLNISCHWYCYLLFSDLTLSFSSINLPRKQTLVAFYPKLIFKCIDWILLLAMSSRDYCLA